MQDLMTIGGVAQAGRVEHGFSGSAVANTFGGSRNTASGFGFSATQQMTRWGVKRSAAAVAGLVMAGFVAGWRRVLGSVPRP
jgi:hypothetical protein